ncbi:MAG: fused MFS/spermidine synthase [Fimbriimonadaceae bacterium]|nr:fused MFS/spermidine synthase [Fimbriimonadaceae bacterium]
MPQNYLSFPIRSDRLTMTASISERVLHRTTEFQTIDILDTDAFGRVLLLDNHIQLTELDEHAYHEALVQIPLLSLPNPRTALVIGGGDGGVLRELAKHASIDHVDMVEIDPGVIEASKEHLPFVSDGGFDDPRMHVHVGDAFPFVKSPPRQYDLIVADSTDTYEEEDGALSEMLFSDEFYRDCLAALSEDGVLVTQADNLLFCPYSLESIKATFDRVFPLTGDYHAIIPSFGGFSGYCWASKGRSIGGEFPTERASSIQLRYLNEATWKYAFCKLAF